MSRKTSVFTLLLLGALGLLAVSSATGASEVRKPAPRVGVSGTIGPVCGRNHGDGTLRFIRLGQHCKKGETYFYLHVRFKANPKGLRGSRGFPGPQGAAGARGVQGLAGVGALASKGDNGRDWRSGPAGHPGWSVGSMVGSRGRHGCRSGQPRARSARWVRDRAWAMRARPAQPAPPARPGEGGKKGATEPLALPELRLQPALPVLRVPPARRATPVRLAPPVPRVPRALAPLARRASRAPRATTGQPAPPDLLARWPCRSDGRHGRCRVLRLARSTSALRRGDKQFTVHCPLPATLTLDRTEASPVATTSRVQ